jgi:GNAT superfamily N-acetyltransferase
MTTEFRLAKYNDFDLAAVVAIARAIRPDDFTSVTDLRDWNDNQRRAARMSARWLACVDDTIVGSAYVGESPWLERTMIIVHVMVHPSHQGRGYGRDLLERAEATATEHGAERVIGWTDETQPRSMRFLERAGFHENDREWQSTLDLARTDSVGLQELIDRIASGSVRIMSVAALSEERRDWKSELYRLYTDVEADVPTQFPLVKMSFEDFKGLVLGRQLVADGFLIAMDGERMVGLTEPHLVDDDPTAIAQEMTGVRSDHRGRGIATALKAATVTWAKQNGFTSIRTNNAQSNAPMLAVNTRLGFEQDHATIEYLKVL